MKTIHGNSYFCAMKFLLILILLSWHFTADMTGANRNNACNREISDSSADDARIPILTVPEFSNQDIPFRQPGRILTVTNALQTIILKKSIPFQFRNNQLFVTENRPFGKAYGYCNYIIYPSLTPEIIIFPYQYFW
jgi:hypothetical protein